jgi:hypothetical protein
MNFKKKVTGKKLSIIPISKSLEGRSFCFVVENNQKFLQVGSILIKIDENDLVSLIDAANETIHSKSI